MRKMKGSLSLLTAFLALAGALYAGLWLYSWQRFTQEIDSVYAQAPEKDLLFLGAKPKVTGFPFVPEISYTHGVRYKDVLVTFPMFHVRGYPLPGRALNAVFPEGLAIAGKGIPAGLALDFFNAVIRIPNALPESTYAEDLLDWQQKGGLIDVPSFTLTRETMSAAGYGQLSLDEDLQPAFEAQAALQGYSDFIDLLVAQDAMAPFPAMASKALLNGLSETDPQTGRQSVSLTVQVRNRTLSAGPVQAVRLPKIAWPRKNQKETQGSGNPPAPLPQ